MKDGITFLGNIIVDRTKHINCYPQIGMLSYITKIELSAGGCAFSTSVDMKRLAPEMRINVIGAVGNDADGAFALGQFKKNGVGVSNIRILDNEATSFTDVMLDDTTHERTFFQYGGVTSRLDYDFVDFDLVDTRMFHMGYALLLDGMDAYDKEYGTQMARTLARARSLGAETSFDVVSSKRPDAARIIQSSLKQCDRVVFNEIEASAATGIEARGVDGRINEENVKRILCRLMELGVRKTAVIHCPEYGFAMDNSGQYFKKSSLRLPEGFIKGTTGAGDAFCAGMLLSIYDGLPLDEALAFANGVAAASLRHIGGTEAVPDRAGVESLIRELS